MSEKPSHELDRLFLPRSIAVVGASPKIGRMVQANNYIKGSITQNFHGKIFPVHPKAMDTLGYKAAETVNVHKIAQLVGIPARPRRRKYRIT